MLQLVQQNQWIKNPADDIMSVQMNAKAVSFLRNKIHSIHY